MEIRRVSSDWEIAGANAIDEAQIGSAARAGYINSVAASGGLNVAVSERRVQAFCCLDHRYFFEKPFISLLVVSPSYRRRGLGTALISFQTKEFAEVWTSTNRSNIEMRALLKKTRFRFCGELAGLDEDNPEQFFKFG